MSILCAVDFSETSALALQCAREIADHHAQPLTIVTVVDPLLAAAEQVQAGAEATSVIRQSLARFVDEHVGSGRPAGQHLQVRIGEVAPQVLEVARDAHAQLLVMGTQGGTGVEKLMFGSTAERLLRTTDRPVMVVPPAFGTSSRHVLGHLRHVLAPVDFHDHALDDARVAARIAQASHARLHLLHVLPDVGMTRWTIVQPLAAPQLAEQWQSAHVGRTESAMAALQRLVEALELRDEPGIEVEEGNVADVITKLTARLPVDLVVMGLRGAAAEHSGRVGSVAYRVLSQCPVPVLALPPQRSGQVLGFLG